MKSFAGLRMMIATGDVILNGAKDLWLRLEKV